MATAWLYWGSGLLLALGGVALLGWSVFGDRARGRKRCPKCWYDMQRAISLRCPECGHSVKQRQQFFRTRRRWRWAAASMAVFLLAGIIAVQPKVQRDGWGSLVPATILLALFSSRHHEWAKEHLWERMLVDSGRSYFGGVIRVQSPDRLSRWQWRWLARQLITMLQRDDLVAAQFQDYMHHLFLAADFSNDDPLADEAYRIVRSMFDHEDVQIGMASIMLSIDQRDPIGSAALVVPYLHHATPELAQGAATALRIALMRDPSHAALPYVMQALDSPDGMARTVALGALRYHIEPHELTDAALERIEQLEHDPHEEVREVWVSLMIKVGRMSPEQQKSFALRMLRSHDVAQRRGALDAMMRQDLHDSRFDGLLLRAFRDEDLIVRRMAAHLVQSIPPARVRLYRPLMADIVRETERGQDQYVDIGLDWIDQILKGDAPAPDRGN